MPGYEMNQFWWSSEVRQDPDDIYCGCAASAESSLPHCPPPVSALTVCVHVTRNNYTCVRLTNAYQGRRWTKLIITFSENISQTIV